MPYDADIRSSYCSVELNMSWFYHFLEEVGEKIEFKPSEEKEIRWVIENFENHIEKAFQNWTIYKVFGHKIGEYKYDLYDNVWEFLREIAIDYSENKDNNVILEN